MTFQPGDILLVRDYSGGSDLLGNLIMAGERARYGNSDYARWTHSAMIVSADGDLVEAMSQGVARGHVNEYTQAKTPREVLVISPGASKDKRAFAVAFAEAHVGDSYDKLDFLTLAGSLLTGLNLSLHSDKRFICSGLCARATECYTASGYQFPSEAMMPGDLGDYWKALSGDPLPPLAFFGRVLNIAKAVAWSLSPWKHGIRP